MRNERLDLSTTPSALDALGREAVFVGVPRSTLARIIVLRQCGRDDTLGQAHRDLARLRQTRGSWNGRLLLRLTKEERDRIDLAAAVREMTAADWLRIAVDRELNPMPAKTPPGSPEAV